MKKTLAFVLSVVMLLTLTACGNSGGSEEAASEYTSIKLKMSTTVGEASNATQMCKLFAEKVNEATGGAVDISVFSSDQLSGGDMSKGVDMLTSGGTDCAFEPVDVLASLDERLLTLNVAWTFDSYADAEAMLNGTAGEFIAQCLADKNLTTLGFIHNGMRQLTNSKREVVTPDDIKGLKLRVPGGEPFMRVFTEFGADPLTMSFSELYTALSQGTVDGQENGYDLIYNNSFHEVQSYITEWNYSYGAFALVFNTDTWNKLNDATKAVMQAAAEEVCHTGCENVVNNESLQKEEIIQYGCSVTVLTEEQIRAFQSILVEKGYYDYFYNKYGADAFEAFGIDITSLKE